jgi:mannose-6-phosphate isomerase-like protein (cupin superfamily)
MWTELHEDPILRQRYRFSRDGDVLRVEVWADPGARVPDHLHPALEERWEVLEGDVTFTIDGAERRAGAGDRLVAAVGVRHAFENSGTTVAHLRVEAEPPLALQEFLVEGAALNRTGGFTPRGTPKGLGALLAGADFIDRYQETTILFSPPRFVQRTVMAPLARLARSRRGAG